MVAQYIHLLPHLLSIASSYQSHNRQQKRLTQAFQHQKHYLAQKQQVFQNSISKIAPENLSEILLRNQKDSLEKTRKLREVSEDSVYRTSSGDPIIKREYQQQWSRQVSPRFAQAKAQNSLAGYEAHLKNSRQSFATAQQNLSQLQLQANQHYQGQKNTQSSQLPAQLGQVFSTLLKMR